jgi:hypothetical protein
LSRARPIVIDNETIWFDNKAKATAKQLELLSDLEGIPLDDLLDEGLGQRQVLMRLRIIQDSSVIPAEILERRRQRRLERGLAPRCRICALNGLECEGIITRHHFVPRWLMLEMDNYQLYASRRQCTVPVCLGKHRDLHLGDDSPKSIAKYLRREEQAYAQKMLDDLFDQHPKIMRLLAGGDYSRYEARLVRDYLKGRFWPSAALAYDLPEYFSDLEVTECEDKIQVRAI